MIYDLNDLNERLDAQEEKIDMQELEIANLKKENEALVETFHKTIESMQKVTTVVKEYQTITKKNTGALSFHAHQMGKLYASLEHFNERLKKKIIWSWT